MVTHNSHLAALSEDAYRVEMTGTESSISRVKDI